MENILFSIGNDAKSRRAKNYDMTWPEFIAEMMDYIDEPSLGVEFSGGDVVLLFLLAVVLLFGFVASTA